MKLPFKQNNLSIPIISFQHNYTVSSGNYLIACKLLLSIAFNSVFQVYCGKMLICATTGVQILSHVTIPRKKKEKEISAGNYLIHNFEKLGI